MALSKSTTITKAQIPSLCHLCENSPSIQWKCVDCDLLMCSKCKTKVHSKFKAADDHDVISLKDVSIVTERKGRLNLQNIACKFHKSQRVCLYCNACRKMACPNCVTEEHKKHDLEDLNQVYSDRVRNLEYLVDELKADLQFLDAEENKIENEQTILRNLNATTKQSIISQKDALIKLVELEATKRLQKLEDSSMQQEHAISTSAADSFRFKEETNSKISIIEEALNSDIDTLVNDRLVPSISKTRMPFRERTHNVLKFDPGKVNQKKVSEMFGSFRDGEVEPQSLNVLISHKTNFGVINNVYPCKDGNVLIIDEKFARSMKSVQLKDTTIKTVKETKDLKVYDIVEIEKNKFILSFVDNTSLKQLDPDGKCESFLDLSPLLPRALCLTKSGKLLVSVREQGDPFPLKPTSNRKLMIMKTDGKLIHEYNFDNQNKPLFTFVMRVKTGLYNDIFLIDRTAFDDVGSIVALRYPNEILWRYSGNNDFNGESLFQPREMVITDFGSIVVIDKSSNSFHIIDFNGILKNTFNFDRLDIIFPMSLTIDQMGFLWIGCSNEKRKSATGAMLHVVKFSGF